MKTLTSTQKNLVQSAKELGPIISQYIDQEKSNRRLSKPVLDALKDAGLFRMFLPRPLGGLETDPITAAKVVEEVALHNTAAAWSLMVANVTTWFGVSRLPEKGIDEIYKTGPDTFLVNAFHPPKKAIKVSGGYLINGSGPLFSNVHEGQWIFITAFVMEHDEIKMSNGYPEVIGTFMKPDDCDILDTWHTFGMQATDSNDVAARDVFVPDHLFFPLTPEFEPSAYFKSALYRYPAIGACIASLIAPVALAVARNAVNELKGLAEKKTPFGSATPMKERGVVQRKLGEAEALVQSSRAYLYEKLTEAWNKISVGEKVSLEEKASLLLAAAHSSQSCVKAVDIMYSAAGSNVVYTNSKLGQYFSDIQVIRQHGFVNESRYETAAQIYLGLQPDLPVVTF